MAEHDIPLPVLRELAQPATYAFHAASCGHHHTSFTVTRRPAPPTTASSSTTDSAAVIMCHRCHADVAEADRVAQRSAVPVDSSLQCMLCLGTTAVRMNLDLQAGVCDDCWEQQRQGGKVYEPTAPRDDSSVPHPDLVAAPFVFVGPKESAMSRRVLDELGIRRVLICGDAIPAYLHYDQDAAPTLGPGSAARGATASGVAYGSSGSVGHAVPAAAAAATVAEPGPETAAASLPAPPPHILYHRLPIHDSLGEDLRPFLPSALAFIAQGVLRGEKCLVHCNAGVSRSGAVAVEWIRRTRVVPLDQAWAAAKRARRNIHPNSAFIYQLQSLEEQDEARRGGKGD